MELREIEDPKRYRTIGRQLDKAIRERATHKERRTISFPGDQETRDVYFFEGRDGEVLWYAHWQHAADDKDKVVTLLGHGKPRDSENLYIDVQFNYPVETFHRRMGGVFLEHVETGAVMLAHRGILTRKTRVPLDVVLEAMAPDVVQADTSRGAEEFILAAALDSPTLVDDLGAFARRLRMSLDEYARTGIARSPVTGPGGSDDGGLAGAGTRGAGNGSGKNAPEDPVDPLRDYFEEFSGERRAYIPKKTYPVSHHGKVVHAVHEAMQQRGKTLKSRAVDLVAELADRAILFEVKTSADTSSIYSAVGQLSVHAPAVIAHLNKPLSKVLVVPEKPSPMLTRIVTNNLETRIVVYTISPEGVVEVKGLDEL